MVTPFWCPRAMAPSVIWTCSVYLPLFCPFPDLTGCLVTKDTGNIGWFTNRSPKRNPIAQLKHNFYSPNVKVSFWSCGGLLVFPWHSNFPRIPMMLEQNLFITLQTWVKSKSFWCHFRTSPCCRFSSQKICQFPSKCSFLYPQEVTIPFTSILSHKWTDQRLCDGPDIQLLAEFPIFWNLQIGVISVASRSQKELKFLAGARAGILKFRLRLPAPGQTKVVY
jgi:hypothetical protein